MIMMDKYCKVYLDKNFDYVFCFLKEQIIEESDCDMYPHNLECDKNKDFWGRTHTKGSNSGIYIECEGIKLNECRYCLEDHQRKEYVLSADASSVLNNKTNSNKGYNKLRKLFRR